MKRTTQIAALGATLALGMAIGQAMAAQPHMEAALSALQTAKSELREAVADKGGHRVKAMADVDSAISEVKAGIDFARTH
jgi:hypothetical protein